MPADEMTTAKRLREMRAYINTHPDLSRYCQLLEQAAIELESLNGPSHDLVKLAETMAATGASAVHIVELIRAHCGATHSEGEKT